MRLLLLALILTLGAYASAQDIYKTIDADGNIVYSDTPPSEGAAPAELPDIIMEPSLTPTIKLSPDETTDATDEETIAALSVRISSPKSGDVILASASSIRVSGSANRSLADDEYSQLFVNGQPYGAAGKGFSWSVGNLIRGDYSLQIQVVKGGRTAAFSQTVKVFVQRHIAR